MGRLKHLGNKTRMKKHPLTEWEKYYQGYDNIFSNKPARNERMRHKNKERT